MTRADESFWRSPIVSGLVRFQIGGVSIVLGKPPYPNPQDKDTLSRLALAYGVRRDMHKVGEAVRDRVGLAHDRATLNAVVGVVAATISMGFGDPEALDRLASGEPPPKSAKEHAVMSSAVYVQSPEDLVDAVFADFQAVLSVRG